MKSLRNSWYLLAVFCLLNSCAKELAPEPVPEPEPEVEYVTLCIKASVDIPVDSTKTYMSGTTVKWKVGDKVTIYMDGFDPIVSDAASNIGSKDTYAEFTYQVPVDRVSAANSADKYIYYGNGNVTCNSNKVPTSVSVPSVQTYAGSDCFGPGENFSFGHIGPNQETCTLYNIFGILKVKIKLSTSQSISYVQLVDNGDSYLAGEYALSNVDGIPNITHTSGSPSQSRSLIKKVSSTVSDDGYFYFLVPPGTLSNFSLYVYTSDGFYGGKTIKLNTPIGRAKIKTLELDNFKQSTTLANNLPAANSFIVPAASGTYTIPAQYKGNSSESVGSAACAEIMWQGQLSDSVDSTLISSAVYFTKDNNGYIRFKRSGAEGNALVAVKDIDGNILWSWHLWITSSSDITAINAGKVLVNSSSQPVVTIMDRNIGALNIENNNNSQSHGLAYQYGRKDPFMGSRYEYFGGSSEYASFASIFPRTAIWCDMYNTSFNMDYSMKHPNIRSLQADEWCSSGTPSWNGTGKTLDDPCPDGWRVLEKTKLENIKVDSLKCNIFGSGNEKYYSFILYNDNSAILFPATGKAGGNLNVDNVGREVVLWTSAYYDKYDAYQLQIKLDENNPLKRVSTEHTRVTMPVRCQRESTPSPSLAPSLVSSAECQEDEEFEVVYID